MSCTQYTEVNWEDHMTEQKFEPIRGHGSSPIHPGAKADTTKQGRLGSAHPFRWSIGIETCAVVGLMFSYNRSSTAGLATVTSVWVR